MIAFGPVPSRRLGQSLGINNIPPKVCSYSCVYCQLGSAGRMSVDPSVFYPPEEIFEEVKRQLEKVRPTSEPIDYLTFVSDGEPTLDRGLSRAIELLKPLGIKIAVISNASLLWRPEVRDALSRAEWVSLKLDAAEEVVWRRINRPYGKLRLASVMDGMLEFAANYRGKLVTETMLVRGVNDGREQVEGMGEFLRRLNPFTAYLSIPTRPPAEEWVGRPDEATLHNAYQILKRHIPRVECLMGYEGNAFAHTGNVQEDLLNITSVHPMREDAVTEMLRKAKADWTVVQNLLNRGLILEMEHEGRRFFMRRFHSSSLSN
ncbi:radical SAM protein [Desulforhabdus amnigena]|uniref:Radical SAM protein n=1 Tax=Desulforhabdus amnigena TaxID=40218 RepID=A0A9W6LA01_9BACT|nr:radical SAM protein [Desulforhabdus amnigena]NLJ28117.1 radical SAM protein [Deltaproteobacteria bacterium]GLI35491.1 radical SAM protein [Desulforhabdus amnigena]